MRDEIIAKLNVLIRHTEEIYLALAKQFPEMLKEMENGVQSSSQFVADFRSAGGRTTTDENLNLDSTIKRTQFIIENAASSFREIHEEDSRLFSTIEEGIGRLTQLETYISRIHEDSEAMEIISLNAMTVALKAGSAGRAFSYITEELKRLSTKTIGLTEDLTRQGKYLLETFERFRGRMQEVKGFQENLFSELEGRLRTSFNELNRGLEQLIEVLSALIEKAKAVNKPLLRIMEEIQLQDIIRQSIDHVIISLQEMRELSSFDSKEELLDELSFFRSLPALCTSLLDDVQTKLKSSLQIFHEQEAEARRIIENLETERRNFLDNISNDKKGGSLAALFSQASGILKELLRDLETSVRHKDEITSDSKTLTQQVLQMENTFKTFETIVSRFHSVDIASRIEVAKQEILRKMTGTVEEMTLLTGRIEKDVGDSLNATKEFIKTTNASIRDYTGVFQAEADMIKKFEVSIREAYDKLFEASVSIGNSLSGFSVFTGQFVTLFADSRKLLDSLSILVEDIDKLKEKLQDIKEKSELQMQPLLAGLGKTEWNIENKKLQDIIKRFTIFTHKKTAGSIGGFAVEEGVPPGEITMF